MPSMLQLSLTYVYFSSVSQKLTSISYKTGNPNEKSAKLPSRRIAIIQMTYMRKYNFAYFVFVVPAPN